MTANRTAVVEALAERLDLDLTAANEIVVCLLAETIADTWKLAISTLGDYAQEFTTGSIGWTVATDAALHLEQHQEHL